MGKRARARGVPRAKAAPAPPAPILGYQTKLAMLIDWALTAVPDGERSVMGGLRVRFVQMPDQSKLSIPTCFLFERGGDGRVWGVRPSLPGYTMPPVGKVRHEWVAAISELAGLSM